MNPQLATIFAALVVASGSVLVAVITVRQNRRGAMATNQLEVRKVDLEEFREVQARNEAALTRLDRELVAERQARERSDERAEAAEQRARRAEQRTTEVEQQGKRLARRLSRSERRVLQLEGAMAAANVPVPTAEPDPSDS